MNELVSEPTSRPPFPFIVGRGRSGTTLVRAMLDSHQEMAVPNETHFIVSLAERRARYESPSGFDTGALITDLRGRPGFQRLCIPEAAFEAELEARSVLTYADAVRTAFSLYAASRGKARYADKTPIYVLFLPLLAKVFDEARFVHVIRDGRDVALSYLSVEFGPDSIEEAAFLWKRAVRSGLRAGRQLGPERSMELRYEALVADPEGTMRRLCDFAGLPFDAGMLDYASRADEVTANVGYPDAHRGIYRPPTQGLRDWRTEMTREDRARFEALAGDVLDELGYERSVPRLPLSVRIEAGRHWLRIQKSRLGRKSERRRHHSERARLRDSDAG